MKLSKSQKNTESEMLFSLNNEKVSMGINMSAMSHIIARLTDLYSNPIEATIREVISNAIDTTKKLSKDDQKEVKVFLPNRMNPSFVVEDFGEGMSKETMERIYSQYGSSTKGDDFSQIGAFGLGAKAPLSYCSSFLVMSTKDSWTTEMILSSEKEGNFARITRHEKTNLPNGTKVSIPAKENDIDRFYKIIKESYKKYSYDVKINVIGKLAELNENNSTKLLGEIDLGNNIKLKAYTHTNFQNLLINYLTMTNRNSVGFTLSGWPYLKGEIMIDLIPGLVDFSSSRDEITKNERFHALEQTVDKKISDLLLTYINNMLQDTNKNYEKTLMQAQKELMVRYTKNHNEKLLKKIITKNGQTLYDKINEKGKVSFFRLYHKGPTDIQYYFEDNKVNQLKNWGVNSSLIVGYPSSISQLNETKNCLDDSFLRKFFSKKLTNLIFVYDVDKNNIQKLIRRRKKIMESNLDEGIILGFSYLSMNELKNNIQNFIDSSNWGTITYRSYDEIMAATKPERSQVSKKREIINSALEVRVWEDNRNTPFVKYLNKNEKTFDYLVIKETPLFSSRRDWFFYKELINKKTFVFVNPKVITLKNIDVVESLSENVYVDKVSYSIIKAQKSIERVQKIENTSLEQLLEEINISISDNVYEYISLKKLIHYNGFSEKAFKLAEDFKDDFFAENLFNVKKLMEEKSTALSEVQSIINSYSTYESKLKSYNDFLSFHDEYSDFRYPLRNELE